MFVFIVAVMFVSESIICECYLMLINGDGTDSCYSFMNRLFFV